MTLTDLAAIGTIVSGVAVVVSLIYLSFQIRQNTHHHRASMQQGRAGRTVELLLGTATPDAVRVLLHCRAGDPDVAPAELEQFLRIATAIFISFEDGYVLRRTGMLDAATIAGDDASMVHHIVPWPGYRMAWEMLKSGMQPDFRAYVDSLIAKTPPMASTDRAVTWRRLAAEPAGTDSSGG
jgi:hypothetical protein